MKRTSSLWGSISMLIGVVIAILALTQGNLTTILLIAAFSVWGLWLIFTQLRPSWQSNREYRQRMREQRQQQENALKQENPQVGVVLLRHVNHRISEQLKSAYPNAQWEWTLNDPVSFAARGGTGRIRVYGVPDYDYADVTLNQQGEIRCALVKLSPLKGNGASTAKQHPLDPRAWYELHGRKLLESLVADLSSRGHSSLTLNEDGSISIKPVDSSEPISKGNLPCFPEKVYWPQLAKVLEQEGLMADVQNTKILVSW